MAKLAAVDQNRLGLGAAGRGARSTMRSRAPAAGCATIARARGGIGRWTGLGSAARHFLLLDFLTMPPPMPDYAAVRAAWQPSEAWLYDRNGVLIDSARVDFARRRLGWTPLDKVAPPVARGAGRGGGPSLLRAWRGRLAGDARRAARPARGQAVARRIDAVDAGRRRSSRPISPAPGARGWLDKIRQMRAGLGDRRRVEQARRSSKPISTSPGYRGEAQGIGAAALGLFGKTPDALSRDDALLLAALLPDPQAERRRRVARRACAAGARARIARASRPRPARCSARRAACSSIPASRRISRSGC